MNERIRKLALETDAWCDQNWAGHKFYNIRWEEKFAELIVRECVSVVQQQYSGDLESGYHRGLFSATEIIKEHFGVE